MLKANPSTWDIGTALRDGTALDWWRLAHSYRAELVDAGHPCVMWVTRGDPRVSSGVWAAGEVLDAPSTGVGDPSDPLWRDVSAREQPRPRIPVRLELLGRPVLREELEADPRLSNCEILRVPRIGNPASLTPAEWGALVSLLEQDG